MNKRLFLKRNFPKLTYYLMGKLRPCLLERNKIFKTLAINTIFDIGANIGEYAYNIRNLGYKGKIISFEPLNEAFESMKKWSENDSLWDAYNLAVGDENCEIEINISKNSVSSSILPMNDFFSNLVPDAGFTNKQKAECRTLETLINQYCDENDKIFVKMDTQGFELRILTGAECILNRISGFQLELSLKGLYTGEPDILTVINWLDAHNFKMVMVEPGWHDMKSGYMMETDAIFVRKDLLEKK